MNWSHQKSERTCSLRNIWNHRKEVTILIESKDHLQGEIEPETWIRQVRWLIRRIWRDIFLQSILVWEQRFQETPSNQCLLKKKAEGRFQIIIRNLSRDSAKENSLQLQLIFQKKFPKRNKCSTPREKGSGRPKLGNCTQPTITIS